VSDQPTVVTVEESSTRVTVTGDTVSVVEVNSAPTVVIVEPQPSVTAVEDVISVVSVGTLGPPGPRGADGPPGAAGSAPQAYVHDQAVPASSWTVLHSLGYYPNVTVVDTLGRVVVGDVSYPDIGNVVLTFSAAFSGRAFLS
jgi:hypothetical protein